MSNKLFLMIVVFALILAGCGPTAAEPTAQATKLPVEQPSLEAEQPTLEVKEPVKIRVAVFPYTSYAPFYYAKAEGYFAEQGIDVEFIDFTRQAEAIVAMALGEVDVTAGVLDIGSMTAIGASSGMKIVADKGYVDPAACPFGAWMVSNELLESGALDDLVNLKGRKVVMIKGSFFEYAMDKLLEPVGLNVSDLEGVEMPAAARAEALQTGAVDIAPMGEPWITRTLDAGIGQVWYPFETTLPNAQYAVVWYGSSLTEADPDAGNRFMAAYMKAVMQYNEGKTDRNVQLMAEFTQSSEDEIRSSCWQAFHPEGKVNLDFVLDFQQWAVDKKYLDRTMEVDEFWDGRFLEYALDELK